MKKILSVVGNRPQFVKQAMFDLAVSNKKHSLDWECLTVNTGQHYDAAMSEIFFNELSINSPKYNLGIGSGPILDQLGKMLPALRAIIESEQPELVLLFGDTNSTVAGALAAAHSGVPCVHVEGGERLYRRTDVPEEINRVVTDHLSALVLTSSRKALRYLHREGFGPDRAQFVGDIMLDLFLHNIASIDQSSAVSPSSFGLEAGKYILATLHRVENTAEKSVLIGLLNQLDEAPMPVFLPMHPRIKKLIYDWGWRPSNSLRLEEPLGYFDFLSMLKGAALVVSDSGGVTREALFAGKGCIVPLDNCWWTEAVEAGLAIAVGHDIGRLGDALTSFRPKIDSRAVVQSEFGDGTAAEKIVDHLDKFIANNSDVDRREGPWHRLGYFDEIPGSTRRSEFSYSSFKQLLDQLVGNGYKFLSFNEPFASASPVCLMRHDVDFDLEKARDLAKIEAARGVSATYFFMLRTDHYNIFSAEGEKFVREILRLGHHLGLHFDAAAYEQLECERDYRGCIAKEAQILGNWFGREVTAVSFHRPSKVILEGSKELSDLPHTYDRELHGVAEYVSDSGGCWQRGSPLDRQAFAVLKPLHILIHPIWWGETPTPALESLMGLSDNIQVRNDRSFALNCSAFRVGYLARNEGFSG